MTPMKRRLTAVLLGFSMIIGLLPALPSTLLASEILPTTDIADGDAATDRPALDRENHNAYLVGYEDGTVRPQNPITRAEVATIFFRLLTDNGRDRYLTTESDFTDVSADAWYNTPVSTLVNAGILSGYEDGSFRPDAAITRAEFAAVATRFIAEDGISVTADRDSSFTDVGDAWYAEAVEVAEIYAIISGYPDGSFRPEKAITRAETCSIINRTLDREFNAEQQSGDLALQNWSDNDPDSWYYYDILEATNSHEYTFVEDSGQLVEVWTEIIA